MTSKRFYWLKMQDEFFNRVEIKKLRKIAGGDTFTIIYLKMLLLSIRTEGVLTYEGLEVSFADELALRIDEDASNIKMTLAFLESHRLIMEIERDEMGNIQYFLKEAGANIGSESESAQRVRRHRLQEKEGSQKHLGCPNTLPLAEAKKVEITNDNEAGKQGSESVDNPQSAVDNTVDKYRALQCNKNVTVDNFSERPLQSNENATNPLQCNENLSALQCNKIVTLEKSREEKNREELHRNLNIENNKRDNNINNKLYINNIATNEKEDSGGSEASDTERSRQSILPKTNVLDKKAILEKFLKFVSYYPRATNKSAQLEAVWNRMLEFGIDPDDLVYAAFRYSAESKHTRIESRFIKNPSNFLKQETWKKYIPEKWKKCPRCRGEGAYKSEDGQLMILCSCKMRYADIHPFPAETGGRNGN